jgi:hypothetical protein
VVAPLVDEAAQFAELPAAEHAVVIGVEPAEQRIESPRPVTVRTAALSPVASLRVLRSAATPRRILIATPETLAHLIAAGTHRFAGRLSLFVVEHPVAVLVELVEHPLLEFGVAGSAATFTRWTHSLGRLARRLLEGRLVGRRLG